MTAAKKLLDFIPEHKKNTSSKRVTVQARIPEWKREEFAKKLKKEEITVQTFIESMVDRFLEE